MGNAGRTEGESGSDEIAALLLVAGLVAFSGCATPESSFPTLTNDARKAAGKGPLSTEPPGGLYFYNRAREQAEAMCRARRVYHAPNWYSGAPAGWRAIGENVGSRLWNANDQTSWTNSTNALFQSFMNSPGHKAIILGNYNYQVVAQHICGDGHIYVTHVFVLY